MRGPFRGRGRQFRLLRAILPKAISSVGVGVRTQLLDNLYADLELAKPVVSEPATMDTDKDPRLSFQVMTRF